MTGTVKPETKKLIDQIKEPCILITGDGLTLIAGMKPATAIGVLEISKKYLLDKMVRDISTMERKEMLKEVEKHRTEWKEMEGKGKDGKGKEGNSMEGESMEAKSMQFKEPLKEGDNPFEQQLKYSIDEDTSKRTTINKGDYHLFRVKNYNRFGNELRQSWKLVCPKCLVVGELDTDQWHGRISIECVSRDCKFHETINFGLETGEDG